jgi:hypothetical protein
MKGLKSNHETKIISIVFFAIYIIYGFLKIPLVQYMVSIAVGGIAYGIFNSYEIAIVSVLFMSMVYPLVGPTPIRHEGYKVDPLEISNRIAQMKNNKIKGVGSKMSEGFEDAKATDMTLNENKGESDNTENVTASSKPAVASKEKKTQPAVSEPAVSEPAIAQPAVVSPPTIAQPAIAQPAVAEVQPSPTDNGLFKLGQIPADTAGGFHIDAGTTVINALKALKPDQIQAMTQDTKQLIETQKALMGMLQSFAPMVTEGKQMMDTFGTMFNPAMGAAGTMGAVPKPPSA